MWRWAEIEASVSPESLNELHRGAVIIRGCRIERAAVPITWTDVVERAAELGSGVAIGVDEDTGQIQVVHRTGRLEVVDLDGLAGALRLHAARLHS